MTEFTIQIENKSLIEAFRKGPDALRRHMNQAVLRSVMEIARTARANAPKGVSTNAPKGVSTLTHSIKQRMVNPLTGEVKPHVDYARYVEEGIGPGGSPPLSAMRQWIKAKGITPRNPNISEADLPYVIARHIAINGTPAQPYLMPAFESKKARAEQLISLAIDKTLQEMRA